MSAPPPWPTSPAISIKDPKSDLTPYELNPTLASLVLNDRDILENVFRHFGAGFSTDKSRLARTHLYWAAQTCHSFSTPAIDTIWASMNNLIPLFKILPSFKLLDNVYAFLSPTIKKEPYWTVFQTYAKRIRELTMQDIEGPKISDSAYVHLGRICPALFSNLRRLICIHPNISLLCLFTTPYLQNLRHIEFGDSTTGDLVGQAVATLVACDGQSLPIATVHDITLHRPSDYTLTSVRRLSNLRRLVIEIDITLPLLTALGALEHLEEFSVKLSKNLGEFMEIGFPKLKHLWITGTFEDVSQILDRIAAPTLLMIRMVVPVAFRKKVRSGDSRLHSPLKGRTNVRMVLPPYDGWLGIFRCLNRRWAPTLHSISIAQDETHYAFTEPLPLGLFSDLSPFQQLQYFATNNTRFTPTDIEIHNLAAVMPNIRDLRLNISDCAKDVQTGEPPRSPSIKALWALAELCPKLHFLQIGLDLQDIPPFSDDMILNHRLKYLSVGSLPLGVAYDVKKCHDVGRHIFRLFPYLEDIQTWPDHAENDWKMVLLVVRSFQDVSYDILRRASANRGASRLMQDADQHPVLL